MILKKSQKILSFMASSLSLQDIISNINYHLKNTIEGELVRFYVYDEVQDELLLLDEQNNPQVRLSPRGGVLQKSFHEAALQKVEDVVYDTSYDKQYDSAGIENVRNLIWSPVISKSGEFKGKAHFTSGIK